VLQTIMEKLSELLHPTSWSLLLLDEKTNELQFEIAVGEGAAGLKDARIQWGQGVVGACAERSEPIVVRDAQNDSRFDEQFDELTGVVTRTIVCVPITGRNRTHGVIELVNIPVGEGFESEELPVLANLADYAAIALDNARYVARIHELTITDEGTQLFNARHLAFVLDSEVYRAARYNYELSLVFVDLDHFKEVNDRYGHAAGSQLLFRVAELLKGHIRLIDTAFRFGGDEFVLVFPQTSKADALTAVRRIRKLLRSASFLKEEGIDHPITASFGIASFPDDGKNREELIKSADAAMYRVKDLQRDGIVLAGNPPLMATGQGVPYGLP
jgi:diguanylate cyclase (GGDEF)-like protein